MSKRYRSGWWLEQKYWDEGLTQREIAEECGVSPRTFRTYMTRFGIETRELSGTAHPLYGSERDPETKRKIANSLTGRELSEEWRERIAKSRSGRSLPQETREKISESLEGLTRPEETRERMSKSTAGSANPNWKGGYSRYYGPGWSVARDQVRDRDEHCQACGHDGSERRLVVHHTVPVRKFRESATASVEDAHDLQNLVLLCNRCHTKADFGTLESETDLEPPDLSESCDGDT